ncbi:sensor histidine kinase [Deinococcus aerophilus]|nr:PAS domain-containing sensor histidine kinase [Deinococcus aerophilus]
MAARMREFDWAGTRLGPPEAWPPALRTAVGITLSSAFPILLLWGPDFTQLYNDACRDLMGDRHPGALGHPNRVSWPELWAFLEPVYQGVYERGETFRFTDQRFMLTRHGQEEEAYFTLGYGPVHDETGAVGGILVTILETTGQVSARHHLQAQRTELEARTRSLALIEEFLQDYSANKTAYGLIHSLQELLTDYLPEGRMVYCEPDNEGWQVRSQVTARTEAGGTESDDSPWPHDAGWLQIPYETGRPYYHSGLPDDTQSTHAVAMLPVRWGSSVRGVFGCVCAAPEEWSPLQRSILEAAVRSLGLALNREHREDEAREHADAALLASRSRLHFALDAAGLGAWELDTHTQVAARTMRHDEIFGYPQGHPAWTYQTFIAHVLPEDREDVDRRYSAALERGEAWDFQCRIRRADGEVRWIWARGQTLKGVRGDSAHVLGLVQDITQQRLAEANAVDLNTHLELQVRERTRALEEANGELEAFAYSVSHDLRTPLRHIAGFSQLLHRHLGDTLDVKATRYLGVMEDAIGRMDRLLEAMLNLSRISQVSLQVASVDLGQLVEETRGELVDEAERRLVEWQVGPLPQVTGDPAMLRQVMANLLSNALKYTARQEKAVIEVWAEERPDRWALFVRDNGVGFDPRYADKLFGVFQRLHRQDDFEGTGVGLANVRRIVTRHGGEVSATGQPGEGATFGFTVPKARANS